MTEYIKIVPLPILKETAKAVAVPTPKYLARAEEAQELLPNLKILEGWPKEAGVIMVDTKRLLWLPKSQIKIDALTNTVVSVKPWIIEKKDVPPTYDELINAIRQAVKELCEEGRGDKFYLYGHLIARTSKVLGAYSELFIRGFINFGAGRKIVSKIVKEACGE